MYSVRAAMGGYADVACFADIDARAEDGPLAVHDEKWRQNGLEFVEHLISGRRSKRNEPVLLAELPQPGERPPDRREPRTSS